MGRIVRLDPAHFALNQIGAQKYEKVETMGGSSYRKANPNSTRPHSLVAKEKGGGPYKPGKYTCKCGKVYTSITSFERHRAKARRDEKNSSE